VDLYLIRHADAVPLGEGGDSTDANRPLTPTGENQAKNLASTLQSKAIPLGVLLTSPLVRARQTAEGVAHAWSTSAPEIRDCEDLAPGGKRRRLSRLLKGLNVDHVGLVGHEPDLGLLAAWLIGSKKAQVCLAKAGVARISCDGPPGKGKGSLVWMVTPEWFTV
jgi:phosphohistidine phosphatase